jgi:hypothetical protein
MRSWLTGQKERHPPKSPFAAAIRYAENQWNELGVFLDDVRVPLDNNGSERALRRVGRKNYLFVHDADSGQSLAGLYSLVATCEARAMNPFDYLADVLARVQDDPTSAIDELLPSAWAAARADAWHRVTTPSAGRLPRSRYGDRGKSARRPPLGNPPRARFAQDASRDLVDAATHRR